jgi:hypothetical protein
VCQIQDVHHLEAPGGPCEGHAAGTAEPAGNTRTAPADSSGPMRREPHLLSKHGDRPACRTSLGVVTAQIDHRSADHPAGAADHEGFRPRRPDPVGVHLVRAAVRFRPLPPLRGPPRAVVQANRSSGPVSGLRGLGRARSGEAPPASSSSCCPARVGPTPRPALTDSFAVLWSDRSTEGAGD